MDRTTYQSAGGSAALAGRLRRALTRADRLLSRWTSWMFHETILPPGKSSICQFWPRL
jgi:hypothetical protein